MLYNFVDLSHDKQAFKYSADHSSLINAHNICYSDNHSVNERPHKLYFIQKQ